jgi:hypothetical protein
MEDLVVSLTETNCDSVRFRIILLAFANIKNEMAMHDIMAKITVTALIFHSNDISFNLNFLPDMIDVPVCFCELLNSAIFDFYL